MAIFEDALARASERVIGAYENVGATVVALLGVSVSVRRLPSC